jgi:glycosyltransferase involved in cell wall biosynthesis
MSVTRRGVNIDFNSHPPLVSVILPTHNRALILPRAIESVLTQTYDNIELIIVDDCSTDETREVVSALSDLRVTYLRLEENAGGSGARNRGIAIAKGEFIAFQDDDDEWLPHKLNKQMEVFLSGSPNLGLVYTGIIVVQNGFESRVVPKHRGMIFELQVREDHILCTATWLAKKSCFNDKRVGRFDERLPARQDYDMSLRLSKHYAVDFCNECLVRVYRDMESSISTNTVKRVEGHLMVLDKINNSIEMGSMKRRKVNSSHYYSIATYCQSRRSIQESRRFLTMALKQWPLNIRALVFLALLLMGDEDIKIYKVLRRLTISEKK